MAGIDDYAQALRSATRGRWQGVLSDSQFRGAMRSAINRRLEQAFEEGAAECGILPDEFTPEEQIALGRAVNEELGQIGSLATRIDKNSKKNGGKLQPLLDRVSTIWTNRYRDLESLGKQQACRDQKLQWIIGPTEQHCRDCLKYNGRIYRASAWARNNVKPQSRRLSCHGFRCLCSLEPTSEPITKGRIPRPTG